MTSQGKFWPGSPMPGYKRSQEADEDIQQYGSSLPGQRYAGFDQTLAFVWPN
jgi:hypothetical protein